MGAGERTTVGGGLPSKHTLVPLLPKPRTGKEHHSISLPPPPGPNTTAGFQTPTGQGADVLPSILHSGSSPPRLHPRLVMLERPPGGATMRWPVRRGLLSSIWAPGKRHGQSLGDLWTRAPRVPALSGHVPTSCPGTCMEPLS